MGFSLYFSIETWTLIAIVISLLALYGTAPYNFFKKLGIKGPKPLPFIGTFLEYRQDLGLNGPLNDAVSIVEDEDWKRIRSVLSPSFTSGRLKEMYSIMLQHSSNLLKSLQGKVDADEVINVKDVFGPYSMDVVASTAFSVDIDSINRPADPFVANIQKMTKFNFLNPLIVLVVLFPFLRPLIEKMEISLFPADVLTFFYNFLKTIKSDRKKNNCKSRVDFMQLMVDSQISESSKENMNDQKGLTDHEILSQAMIFIFAGYETSSSSMCFFAYNLATNPHIQKALQEEIDETFPNKVRPNYDDLMQMEYLDMVMNESARLYPIATRLERVAKTSVEVCGVTIPKNSVVMVPIYALHRDPSLWPEPESFKPERFGKENKDNIDPYAFLPFGAGPRNCIGMRFALLMMKLALVEILQHYSFVTCKETEIPLELSNEGFTSPKNPIKIKLMPRATTSD
ncbi:cytochrome P450 3A40-like isoform X2 [Corythoichthys intestinalis]|uniref:cytochrome P450 3A40-like isoform X2 n=1 Tax=Corythoichthys intestinalis TaxID=161448 RepID=UPI0025A5D0EC|nr:cytochrome P450 3A40-like isoform X2 [Corythoichthys intestinalis]